MLSVEELRSGGCSVQSIQGILGTGAQEPDKHQDFGANASDFCI